MKMNGQLIGHCGVLFFPGTWAFGLKNSSGCFTRKSASAIAGCTGWRFKKSKRFLSLDQLVPYNMYS